MKSSVQTLRCDIESKDLGLAWLPRITVRRSVVGSACYWHAHDEHEIIFLIEGAATYVFRDHADVHLKGGEFLVIPKGVEHRMPDGLDTPSFRFGFNLADGPVKSPSPLTRSEHAQLVKALLAAPLAPCAISPATKSHLVALAQVVAAHPSAASFPPLARARFRLVCPLVLANCADALQNGTPAPGDKKDDIDAAIDFIERHAEGPLDLKALIRYMGYSRARLFVLFRNKTGLSPAAYHQRRRLARAQELLDTTEMTSEQVSEKLGFESPAYFTYAFRRCFGVTPIAFRRRQAKVTGG